MTETELAFSQRLASLEGKVDALCLLFGGQRIGGAAAAVPATSDPVIPPELHDVIRDVAKGNRPLTRHLYGVVLEMLHDEMEPAVIARRLREGERVP